MLEPKYPHSTVWNLSSLEAALGAPIEALGDVIAYRSRFYHEFERIKPNGGVRQLTSVRDPLKAIQQRIKSAFLDHVIFPTYLHGCVRARSSQTNATEHRGSKHIFTADIESFFDSVTRNQALAVWRGFFKFSQQAAELLADLTTHNNKLPQGACTSPALANLIFFCEEPELVRSLELLGFRYTRYVDDITVSNPLHLSKGSITRSVQMVRGMLQSKGFIIARHKQHFSGERDPITSKGRALKITGLTVAQEVSNPAYQRRGLEIEVYKFQNTRRSAFNHSDVMGQFQSLAVRVGQLKALHPGLHRRLRKRLADCNL